MKLNASKSILALQEQQIKALNRVISHDHRESMKGFCHRTIPVRGGNSMHVVIIILARERNNYLEFSLYVS